MINHGCEQQHLRKRDPLPVSMRAVLLGAGPLEVVDPAHARVLLDEAIDDRLIHEGARCLAPSGLV